MALCRKILTSLLLLALLAGCATTDTAQTRQTEGFKNLLDAVVRLDVREASYSRGMKQTVRGVGSGVILKEEGYIWNYELDNSGEHPEIKVKVKYVESTPAISGLKRVSRPGLRYYRGKEELPKNRAGLGIAILSTNKGLMTDKQAQAAGIGGEVLCTVF